MLAIDMLSLAKDNLQRARLRTALTATGVAIGTAAVVTLVAFGSGAEAIAVDSVAGIGAVTQIEVGPITADGGRQAHVITPAALATIAHLPHVASVDTWLDTPPLRLTLDGRAVDASSTGAQWPLVAGQTVRYGRVTGAAAVDGVLLPDSLARRFGSPTSLVGRAVTVTAGGSVCCAGAGSGGLTVLGPDRRFAARIVAVYDDSAGKGSHAPTLLVSTELGATIDAGVSGIAPSSYLERQGYAQLLVHTDDARQTAAVASTIGRLGYRTFDRADLLARVHLAFTVLKGGLGAIGGIALLVAAVGIANTMIMTILERTREIGVMKALGAEPGTVRALFLIETVLVGLLGGLTGLALAVAGSGAANLVFRHWVSAQGEAPPSSDLFAISPLLALGSLILAAAISLLGGALPSRRAVRLQPLEALRYE